MGKSAATSITARAARACLIVFNMKSPSRRCRLP
jgi:hypothetical protein